MGMKLRKRAALLLCLCLCLPLMGCTQQVLDQAAQILLQEWQSQQSAAPELWTAPPAKPAAKPTAQPGGASVTRGESYTDPQDVADYIHLYGTLPPNFITKAQAQALGWDSSRGNLWDVAPGKSIGGDHFGNYEGSLPTAGGRKWRECDVNYHGGYRGAERVLYSTDGLIYYTGDHYKTFTQLY